MDDKELQNLFNDVVQGMYDRAQDVLEIAAAVVDGMFAQLSQLGEALAEPAEGGGMEPISPQEQLQYLRDNAVSEYDKNLYNSPVVVAYLLEDTAVLNKLYAEKCEQLHNW